MEANDTRNNSNVDIQESSRPYSPSWIDLLADWLDGRRYSYWVYYFGFGAVVLVVLLTALWIEGATISGSVGLAQAYMAGVMAYMLALIHSLDKRAGMALEIMRPSLTSTDGEFPTLKYQLTTLPAVPTLLASLGLPVIIFLAEAVGEPYVLEELGEFPVSAAMLRVVYFVGWLVLGAFLYHTLHQLRAFNLVYTKYTQVDLFRVRPLYAFSNLAALTAGSLAMISYGWLLVNPWIDKTDPQVLIPMIVLLLFALVVFVWPQIGIHRLQASEKERLLDEATQRLETTISELHQQIDDQELENIADLNIAMTTLQTETNILRKTPTWPWEPEVVRLLITALALPLGLWLVQLILQQFLGR